MKFLFNEIRRRPFDHAILILVCLVALLFLYIFQDSPHSQRNVIFGLTSFYFLWSLHHHYQRGDLSISIITEYLLMAALALTLVLPTLFP